MQEVIKTNNRIRYIDALRGLAMFLVVMGHVMQFSFNLGGYKTFLTSVIISIHLPLFFFISGYFAYKAVERWTTSFFTSNLKNKLFVLIVPATIFFSLYTHNPIGYFIKYGFDAYWFTYVLLQFFIIYYTLSLIGRYTYKRVVDVGLILLSFVGVAYLAIGNRAFPLWKYLVLENTCKYLQFFVLGIFCKKYNTLFYRIINNQLFRGIALVTYVIGFFLCYNGFLYKIPLFYSFLHDEVVRFAGVFVIFIFFHKYADYFEKENYVSRSFLLVGQRTLDIYLIHYFFLPTLEIFSPYINSNKMFIVQLIISFSLSVLIVALCLLISNIVRINDACAYYCFGSKNEKKNEHSHYW